jgi:hypothetical protein
MNLAGSIWSFWSGARAPLAGSHKTTVVICPTAELPAQVGLDPAQGMESCSRWPKLQGCSQSCMPQVKFSGEELVEFTARYEGKKCTSCGAVLTRNDWYQTRLAALDPKTATVDIPGSLPRSFLEDSAPSCSACHRAKMSASWPASIFNS